MYDVDRTPDIAAGMNSLKQTIGYALNDWKHLDHERAVMAREVYFPLVKRLRAALESPTWPNAGPVLMDVAEELGSEVLNLLEDVGRWRDRAREARQMVTQQQASIELLEEELLDAQQRLESLRASRARRPFTTKVAIPEQTVVVRSRVQQEIIRLIGQEGLGRSWWITQRVAEAQGVKENSVRNALRKLTQRGLIDDHRRNGKAVRWKVGAGGAQRLVVLTTTGVTWYRGAFGGEPVESEIVVAARRHRSAVHGVGILEARDRMLEMEYQVDDDPDAILAGRERWGARAEPDLLMTVDGVTWPVEVQREVSQRLLDKWIKALSLTGRLALILFSEVQRRKQEDLLREALRRRILPPGTIQLMSLEMMMDDDLMLSDWGWGQEWIVLNSSPGR